MISFFVSFLITSLLSVYFSDLEYDGVFYLKSPHLFALILLFPLVSLLLWSKLSIYNQDYHNSF